MMWVASSNSRVTNFQLQRNARRGVSPKSDDSIAQFSFQIFVVAFGGDVRRTEGVLFQNICADLDNLIRSYADDKGIVSGMMQLAQRQPIIDRGLPFGHIVWNDMSGIEQFTCDKRPVAEKCPSPSLPRVAPCGQIRRFRLSISIPSFHCLIWGTCAL